MLCRHWMCLNCLQLLLSSLSWLWWLARKGKTCQIRCFPQSLIVNVTLSSDHEKCSFCYVKRGPFVRGTWISQHPQRAVCGCVDLFSRWCRRPLPREGVASRTLSRAPCGCVELCLAAAYFDVRIREPFSDPDSIVQWCVPHSICNIAHGKATTQ